MMRRIYTIYRVEMTKILRLKFTYFGLLLVMGAVAGALLAHPIRRDEVSDYAFIAYAAPMALNVVGLMILLVFCSGLIASELGSGTIRLVLVRPLRRREYLAAKLLAGVSYAAGLSAAAAATAWALAFALGDLAGVRSGGEMIHTNSAMRLTFLAALLLNFAPQCAAVSYALLISVCTRSTGAAVGATVGIWLLVDSVKYPLGIAPLLFSSHMESSWKLFSDRCNALEASPWPIIQASLLTSLAAAAVFMALATWVLSRRNLSA